VIGLSYYVISEALTSAGDVYDTPPRGGLLPLLLLITTVALRVR
jgi:hypothetical protein